MGIRFQCPQGHALNVKAFLAGKRGICPECDARFIVPAQSGGIAVPVDETAAAPSSPPALPQQTLADDSVAVEICAGSPQFADRRTRRRQRAKAITLALSAVVVLLLVVLVVVLMR